MDEDILSKYLWDSANIITGFAVAQTIAFAYACAKPEFRELINTLSVKCTISILLFIVRLIEAYAVWWCSNKTILLFKTKEQKVNLEITKIIYQAARGRIIAIIFLIIPTMFALWSEQLLGFPFNP